MSASDSGLTSASESEYSWRPRCCSSLGRTRLHRTQVPPAESERSKDKAIARVQRTGCGQSRGRSARGQALPAGPQYRLRAGLRHPRMWVLAGRGRGPPAWEVGGWESADAGRTRYSGSNATRRPHVPQDSMHMPRPDPPHRLRVKQPCESGPYPSVSAK